MNDREISRKEMREVLKTREGRNVLWRILEQCHLFSSIWRQSAEIHYLAGKQDVGHYVLAEILDADEDAFIIMMTENKQMKEKMKGGGIKYGKHDR